MTFPFGERIVVHRPGTRDDFGDATAGSSHAIEGVAVAPRRPSEQNTPSRNTVTTGLVAYLPFDADILASDTVERFDGTRWQVIGTPLRWRSPLTGWAPGTEVELERVTG